MFKVCFQGELFQVVYLGRGEALPWLVTDGDHPVCQAATFIAARNVAEALDELLDDPEALERALGDCGPRA